MEPATPTTIAEAAAELERTLEEAQACVARVILSDDDGQPAVGLILVHGPDVEEVWAQLDAMEKEWTSRAQRHTATEQDIENREEFQRDQLTPRD